MPVNPEVSELRVEKTRSHATIMLSTGDMVLGCFFVAPSRALSLGPERVGELLNAESGFFPFEVHDLGAPRAVLFNRTDRKSTRLNSSH